MIGEIDQSSRWVIGQTELICQLLAPLQGHHPFVLNVTLVAHQHHLGILPGVRLDLGAPVLHGVERSDWGWGSDRIRSNLMSNGQWALKIAPDQCVCIWVC